MSYESFCSEKCFLKVLYEREQAGMHKNGGGRDKGRGRLPAKPGARGRAQSPDPGIMT